MPSSNGGNGRQKNGRFGKGNLGGPGNPYGKRVAGLRVILLNSVTEEDLEAISRKLVEQAKEGDLASIKLLLGYLVGQPAPFEPPDEAVRNDERQAKTEEMFGHMPW